MSNFKLALAQLSITADKSVNIQHAVSYIKKAKEQKADIVILPECFNSPYGTQYFAKYAEVVPGGETCVALSEAAKENKIYVIGGTIPEKDGDKLFNTLTVWDDQGQLVTTHRKVHLFDVDVKDKIKFYESNALTPGDSFHTFKFKGCKIGLGICHDMRFEEMARIYRNAGCQMLVYPAAFDTEIGPMHWELLQRSRANDNQCYMVCVAPARDPSATYISWGHSQLTSPWGDVLCDLGIDENIVVADIDLSEVEEVRRQIPIFKQRRTDLYDTIYK